MSDFRGGTALFGSCEMALHNENAELVWSRVRSSSVAGCTEDDNYAFQGATQTLAAGSSRVGRFGCLAENVPEYVASIHTMFKADIQ